MSGGAVVFHGAVPADPGVGFGSRRGGRRVRRHVDEVRWLAASSRGGRLLPGCRETTARGGSVGVLRDRGARSAVLAVSQLVAFTGSAGFLLGPMVGARNTGERRLPGEE